MPRSIFITGAAQGIGRAAALKFHQEGWFVGAYDVDGVGLDKLSDELQGERLASGRLDVTDRIAFADAAAAFNEQAGGRFDVIFNNAGLLFTGAFEDIPAERHDKLVDVNIKGVTNGVQAALPYLEATAAKEGEACVLSMSSASAIYGAPEHAVYSATKFAVRALTEALDIELAPKNIKVRDIMPAYVDTGMVQNLEYKPKILKNSGLSHTAEEIAELALTAVHGDKLHTYGAKSMKRMDTLSSLMPGRTAQSMKKMMGEG
ncbi:MAG: SDR family oxidoreductase [Alphaproteobacteria bacterium]